MSDNYATVVISGEDAESFLQGQLTNDLTKLSPGDSQLSAWCSPKGRVIVLATVHRGEDEFDLVLPADMADEIIRRLTMFRFRSKVAFDRRDVRDGELTHANARARLEAGVAEIGPAQSEAYTPHMLNLDLLDAISLDKGCYTGQEVVARTHYRGATKRRMFRFTSSAPVSAGDKVSDGERVVGDVVNAIGTDLLAVVPVERADQALAVDGIALDRAALPYMDGAGPA